MKPKRKRQAQKGRQRTKARYAKAREDAQLEGIIETLPAGAVRSEVVDPSTQGHQQLPEMVRLAVREGWETPGAAKPGVVDQLLEPFFVRDVVLDRDGNQVRLPPDRRRQCENARVLAMLDQLQWKRDHPELAEKGGQVNVGVSVGNQVPFSWERLLETARPANVVQVKANLLEQPEVLLACDDTGGRLR